MGADTACQGGLLPDGQVCSAQCDSGFKLKPKDPGNQISMTTVQLACSNAVLTIAPSDYECVPLGCNIQAVCAHTPGGFSFGLGFGFGFAPCLTLVGVRRLKGVYMCAVRLVLVLVLVSGRFCGWMMLALRRGVMSTSRAPHWHMHPCTRTAPAHVAVRSRRH